MNDDTTPQEPNIKDDTPTFEQRIREICKNAGIDDDDTHYMVRIATVLREQIKSDLAKDEPKIQPEPIQTGPILYLCGPMTGYPDYNRKLFNDMATVFKNMGYHVINPADFPRPAIPTRENYLKIALGELLKSNLVVVLHDWQASWGASEEVRLAQQLKIPVYPLVRVPNAKDFGQYLPDSQGIYQTP